MARIGGKGKRKARITARAPSRALIAVDEDVARRGESARFAEASRALEEALARLRAHEERDVPAYRAWHEAEFAERHRDLGVMRREAAESARLVDDVGLCARGMGIPWPDAYALVRAAMNEGRMDELRARWGEAETEPAWASVDALFGVPDEDFMVFDPLADEAFGENEGAGAFAREEPFWRQDARRLGDPSAPQDAQTVDAHAKSLYRRLTRALHPDMNGAASCPARMTLWHEVQDAYARGDVARLERIHRGVQGHAAAVADDAHGALGRALALRRGIEARLEEARRRLRDAKREPAWDFRHLSAAPGHMAQLRADVDDQLIWEETRLRACLGDLRRRIAAWENAKGNAAPAFPSCPSPADGRAWAFAGDL